LSMLSCLEQYPARLNYADGAIVAGR
jgi:hypothetical protein